MCLILLAYRCHPRHELVIAANRDEFYARPTQAMSFWDAPQGVLAGRDLQAGGTWIGVSRDHRFAGITNYRDPLERKKGAPSRGLLVSEFLAGTRDAKEYLADLSQRSADYSGFNLILADANGAFYYSNRSTAGVMSLQPGVYGLSNHLLGTAWPKVELGRRRLAALLSTSPNPSADELLALLLDKSSPPDEDLPDTGVGLALERRLGSIFIEGPIYGTRSSTALLLNQGDGGLIVESTYPTGTGDATTRRFEL